MQPITACAAKKGKRGTRGTPSMAATRIAATIGPSSSAAGSRNASSKTTKTADRSSITAHWKPRPRAPNDPM